MGIYKSIPKNIAYLPWRGNNAIIFFSSLEWEWRVISTCHGGIKQATGRRKKKKKKVARIREKYPPHEKHRPFGQLPNRFPVGEYDHCWERGRGWREAAATRQEEARARREVALLLANRHDVDDSVEWEAQRTRQLFAHGLYKNPFSLKKKIE